MEDKMRCSSMYYIGVLEGKNGVRGNILKVSGWEFFRIGWKLDLESKISLKENIEN